MKRRIEQLLNGKFEYKQQKLLIAPQEITVRVIPGAVVHGSFHLEGADGKKIRGFLYSSNPRIVCNPVEFQGISNEIHYQIDCSGYEPGMQERSTVTICSDIGEYELPVHIGVEAQASEQEQLPFDHLDGFAELAREDFQRAYRWFLTPGFGSMLKREDIAAASVYAGLGTERSYETMEEFLTGTGSKEPVELAVDRNSFEWKELTEPVRETLVLTKNTWGFQKITVESDARFLRPEKRTITTDEFAGSTFDLNLVIDTNLMHAGRNYARLTISTGRQTLQIEVTAQGVRRRRSGNQNHICKIMMKKLEALYVEFRLKKIDLQTWIEHSVSVINSYKRAGGDDPFADLFLIQLWFADGKKQKAYKQLELLGEQRNRLNTPERYGFYLYMTTFFNQDSSYVDRVEAEIGRMFGRSKTSWKLQWILLYLQESYLNDEDARYEAVAEQFRCGCRSRIMYVEAYHILKKNPFLMRRLGAFELQLLRFAWKEEVLTAELVRQAANLTTHHGCFDKSLYEVLTAGYQMYPSADLVKAICLLLMKGEKKEPEYFEWYEKGVECGLRITGLYEYYMETMDCREMQGMPQIIRMYFAYDTTLDYRRRAAIYRNIVENKERDAQTYHNFRAAMEKFTQDQLETLHITEDLEVLYHCFLRRNMLTRQMAEKLARLLFTYEVTCDRGQFVQAAVHSERLTAEQAVMLQDGRAYVQIYDPDSTVILLDSEGVRHTASGLCSLRKVFDSEEMLAWCAQKAPEHPGIVLYLSTQCLKEHLMNRNVLPYYCTACETEAFTKEFRSTMRKAVLQYYMAHTREESLQEFLEQIPYLEYVKVDKAALITLLAEEGRCSEAFTLLDAYGAEGIPLLQLVRICSRMVLDLEFEENTMLLSMCHSCFEKGKYDDKLLRYLLLYYEGPVRAMKQIWQAARKFELDTMLIEEKIMMMILFTGSGSQGSEAIFEAYNAKMGRRRLCRAYVNMKAYEYFVKDQPVGEAVFQFIEKEYQHLAYLGRISEQEEVCRLALLQHYSRAVQLTPEQRQCAGDLLEEFGTKGLRFAFWQRFDRELLLPYEMEGRVFVEYAADPESVVNIFYRICGREDTYTKETVENYFEGIFVKEFTLFGDEELECWFEEDNGQEKIKTDKRIVKADMTGIEETSRYAMLNRISRAQEQGDGEKMKDETESYLMLEYLAEEVFTLV